MAQRLARNEPLQHLDLTSTSISDDGAEAIFEALRTNTTLTELVLAENTLTSKSLRAAAQVLTLHNSTLRHLDLTCTEVGNDGARVLAGILMLNTSLRTLTLRDAQIGDEGATALSKALRHNTTLEMLDLEQNSFTAFQLSEIERGAEPN